jgi:DNA-3-methyladenine glycosylase II
VTDSSCEPRPLEQHAYGIDHELSDAELLGLAETWRPFRTWVAVMMRALAA